MKIKKIKSKKKRHFISIPDVKAINFIDLEQIDSFLSDIDAQKNASEQVWRNAHRTVCELLYDPEDKSEFHKYHTNIEETKLKLSILYPQLLPEERELSEEESKMSDIHLEAEREIWFLTFNILKLESQLPCWIKPQNLDYLAQQIENALYITQSDKCQLLTKLDRIWIRRGTDRNNRVVKAKYCHAYKIKNNIVDEDRKGYGSLCIGHSKKPF